MNKKEKGKLIDLETYMLQVRGNYGHGQGKRPGIEMPQQLNIKNSWKLNLPKKTKSISNLIFLHFLKFISYFKSLKVLFLYPSGYLYIHLSTYLSIFLFVNFS